MTKKFYAVRKGRKIGIVNTWDDCKKQVMGFSGAEYKSFLTLQEAEAFMNIKVSSIEKTDSEAQEGTAFTPAENDIAIAYVDGSYKASTKEYASGAVLFYKGEKKTFSEKFDDPALAEMRNVAGEIEGAMIVMRYCIEQEIPAVNIYHDYEGVAKWADGLWKANKPGTKNYAEFCRQARKLMQISFVKVKGHSGDRYNDEADMLAKQALGIG